MLHRSVITCAIVFMLLVVGSANSFSEQPPPKDDLAALSDEFDQQDSLSQWQRVHEQEKWNADQLEQADVSRTRAGWLTLVPHTSTWYRDYRGVLLYKQVTGDFVVTTALHTSARDGRGAPKVNFSLAGIMVRQPRNITPQTWKPGGENYLFLSHGAANQPGQYQFEVKTTRDSDSQLAISPAAGEQAMIRVVRIGPHFIMLCRNPGEGWVIQRRYRRDDMPNQLQVGLTVYTDYQHIGSLTPMQHNAKVIRTGQPDLRAQFDYVRYARPVVPAALNSAAWSDADAVSDAQVLEIFGR